MNLAMLIRFGNSVIQTSNLKVYKIVSIVGFLYLENVLILLMVMAKEKFD